MQIFISLYTANRRATGVHFLYFFFVFFSFYFFLLKTDVFIILPIPACSNLCPPRVPVHPLSLPCKSEIDDITDVTYCNFFFFDVGPCDVYYDIVLRVNLISTIH